MPISTTMASRSLVPQRYSSLVHPSRVKDIENLSRRSASASSAMSQFTATSSTDDFIDAKIESITADIALSHKFKECFQGAKKRKDFTDEQYKDAISDIRSEVYQKERELTTLKRQKKAISEDVSEALEQFPTVEEAYSSILMAKIMSATAHQQRKKRFDQSSFVKAVISRYGATRYTEHGSHQKYCHLTGWQPAAAVTCTHLVPKSLESDELAYLFGVRETVLSEPRNGITLNSIIENGLNDGWIVLTPDKPKKGEETIWRCTLVNRSVAPDLINNGEKTWGDLDGKELQFLTPNRPARRYLYLRYVITFMHQRRLGNVEWLDYIQAKGYLWATPGAYLRKSMLRTLARRVSDHFLPEAFYNLTFETASCSPQRSTDDEEDLAMELEQRMRLALAQQNQDKENLEHGEEESEMSGDY